jgi:hypothetical protein
MWGAPRVLVFYKMQYAFGRRRSGGKHTPCKAVGHTAEVPELGILAPRKRPPCHVMRTIPKGAKVVEVHSGRETMNHTEEKSQKQLHTAHLQLQETEIIRRAAKASRRAQAKRRSSRFGTTKGVWKSHLPRIKMH